MKVIDGVKEAEKAIKESLYSVPNSMPWVWITTSGKLLLAGWQGHSSRLHGLFTDTLNPDDAPHVLKQISSGCTEKPTDYINPEAYFERHWIKVTRGSIYIPKKITAKQKIALVKHIQSHSELFFDDAVNYFHCFSPEGYDINDKVPMLEIIDGTVKMRME